MERTYTPSTSLLELVSRYHVCWETWPELLLASKRQRQVGFELELSGTLDTDQHPGWLRQTECRRIFDALHAIAEFILPPEGRPSSMYEITPYEHALHYSAVRGYRPDVALSVKILHRDGFDQPVDDCEVRCLREMTERLKQLGACERKWGNRNVAPKT